MICLSRRTGEKFGEYHTCKTDTNLHWQVGMVTHAFNPAVKGKNQVGCSKFMASLVYKVSPGQSGLYSEASSQKKLSLICYCRGSVIAREACSEMGSG